MLIVPLNLVHLDFKNPQVKEEHAKLRREHEEEAEDEETKVHLYNGKRVVRARFVFWEQNPKQPIIPQEQEEAEKKIEVRTLRIQATERMMQLVFAIKHSRFFEVASRIQPLGTRAAPKRSFGKKPRRKKSLGSGEMLVTRRPPSRSAVVDEHVYDGLNNYWHINLSYLLYLYYPIWFITCTG